MALNEIILPITKPETEWVRGRALQKTGGTYLHAVTRDLIAVAMHLWSTSGHHGRVAPSWRFRVAPPGAVVRPLAPDVAYVSFAVLPADAPRDVVQIPLGAPTVAVEVLSPDDRTVDVEDTIATYVAAGTAALIVIDPDHESIAVHDRNGVRVISGDDRLTHAALPGFALDVGELFPLAKR